MKNREKGKKGWLRRLAERRVRMWLWKKMGPDGAESAYNVLKRYPVKKWPLTIKIIRGLERKKIFSGSPVAVRRYENWLKNGTAPQHPQEPNC